MAKESDIIVKCSKCKKLLDHMNSHTLMKNRKPCDIIELSIDPCECVIKKEAHITLNFVHMWLTVKLIGQSDCFLSIVPTVKITDAHEDVDKLIDSIKAKFAEGLTHKFGEHKETS